MLIETMDDLEAILTVLCLHDLVDDLTAVLGHLLPDRAGVLEATTTEDDRTGAAFGLGLGECEPTSFGCLTRPESKIIPTLESIADFG